MVNNNGLAERGNKIKLSQSVADSIMNQWGSDEDVVFSVEADGVGVNYQWQIKEGDGFVDIDSPYAKVPKFRMPLIKPEDDGKVFRCKIFNKMGATYSNECVLKVQPVQSAPVIITQPVKEVSVHSRNNTDLFKTKTAKIFLNP